MPDFCVVIKSTNPLAYYRLELENGDSEAGTSRFKTDGGVSQAVGAPIGASDNNCAIFDGTSGSIISTQNGGIDEAGSLMAWVNLSQLPSHARHILYIAGESENGNDFDLQFETDNTLKFYTDAGSFTRYKPDPALLVDNWHLIVATMDQATKNRTIYWDGVAVAIDHAENLPNKTAPFTIGASSVWSGRFFAGGIDEVALWNRALTGREVLAIYDATK